MRREFIGIILVLLVLGAWWLWDQQRALPLPPQAANVESNVNAVSARETSFTVPQSADDVRAFYRTALPQRGWNFCGDQSTAGCTNMFGAISTTDGIIDVYRRNDDQSGKGPTIEIWPTQRDGGASVKVFESRQQE